MKKYLFYCLIILLPSLSFAHNIELHIKYRPWFSDIDKSKDTRAFVLNYTPIIKAINQVFSLGLITSLSHLDESNMSHHKHLWAASIGPVFKILPNQILLKHYQPEIIGSVSPSYISGTQLGNKRLGIRFIFKDQLNIGLRELDSQRLINHFGISFIHYSNAGISKDNRGVTLPFSLYIGHYFS